MDSFPFQWHYVKRLNELIHHLFSCLGYFARCACKFRAASPEMALYIRRCIEVIGIRLVIFPSLLFVRVLGLETTMSREDKHNTGRKRTIMHPSLLAPLFS